MLIPFVFFFFLSFYFFCFFFLSKLKLELLDLVEELVSAEEELLLEENVYLSKRPLRFFFSGNIGIGEDKEDLFSEEASF